MAEQKITCPECEAVLKPATPVPAGKKIKCPKCGIVFPVPGEAPRSEAVKPKKPAGPAKRKPGPKKPYHDDDDDGPATYGLVNEPAPEPEDEDDDDDYDDDYDEDDDEDDSARRKKKKKLKSDLEFALDVSVKDPRGPAQAMLIRPSNYMMIWATIVLVLDLLIIAYNLWPFFFAETILTEDRYMRALKMTAPEGKAVNLPERKDLKPDQLKAVQAEEAQDAFERIIWSIILLLNLLLAALVIYGGVKMQTMESWGWGLAGAIISIIALNPCLPFGLIFGIWVIITLNNPKVKAGFTYKAE